MFFPHLSYVLCCCIYSSKDLEQTMLVSKPVEYFYSDRFVAHKSVLVWKYRHAILKKNLRFNCYKLFLVQVLLYYFSRHNTYLPLLLFLKIQMKLSWNDEVLLDLKKTLIICLIMIWRKLYIVNRKSKIFWSWIKWDFGFF